MKHESHTHFRTNVPSSGDVQQSAGPKFISGHLLKLKQTARPDIGPVTLITSHCCSQQHEFCNQSWIMTLPDTCYKAYGRRVHGILLQTA